ncbi:MAG: family 78 glycoside hydrolase catalytic domain, partial [Clostridia bacterium]|nr:family 78 glycoside hydrolase catalytic domain [Clostridia bacterium]
MFRLINVSADHGRIKDDPRSRLCGPLPLFSWGAVSDIPCSKQSACRLQVKAGDNEWDSGWIKTNRQSLRYAGAPLSEGDPVRIRLVIRDDKGNISEPYEAVVYNAEVAWCADWIGLFKENKGETVYLRREFCVEKKVTSAVLYACGLGWQRISLNGEPLDGARLDPANTNYSVQCQYVTYPGIEKRLKTGANCLGAMLGSGWRRNKALDWGYTDGRIKDAGPVQLSAMLRLTYEDGATEWIYTDESWEAGRGANRESDIFNGEIYDARESAVGWDKPGFGGFEPAVRLDAPGGKMTPMLVPPIKESCVRKPVAFWRIGNKTVYDFGQNIAGVLRARLPGNMSAGQTLRLTHAEELDEDGSLFRAPLRSAANEDVYTAAGDGRDLKIWQPLFTYHGFRYAVTEGEICPEEIEAVELHTDLETHSFFRCGDALLTRIHEMCIATERANQHSILTDCPQRDERQGWMNDATVRFEETPYNFDIGRIFPKIVGDAVDEQDEDGAISDTAPYKFGSRPADPVCSAFIVAGLEAWMHTGNCDVLKEHYENYAAWENCLLAHSDGYIVNYSYSGDWAGPEYACAEGRHGKSARSEVTPGVFMGTGYSYFNCRALEKIAGILGKKYDEEKWRMTAEKIRCAMLEKWYDAENAKICTGSQACQSFALWLDLIPENDALKAAKRIHDELIDN